MRMIFRRTLILATAAMALIGLPGQSPAIVIDDTASISASAMKDEEIDPASPILDDFNDGGALNHWGGQTGAFDDGTGSATYSNGSVSPYEGAYCLKLDYNVSTGGTYAGYFSKLESKGLSPYKSLSFWVRGASGGEYFKLELKNNSATRHWDDFEGTHYYRNSAAVYITDYLDGGVTTDWQKVTIPFHNFTNLDGWTSMKELVIVFENSQSVTNGSPTRGTVYIDNISFDDTPVNAVRIDHFGDRIGTCALGGNIGDFDSHPPAKVYSFSTTQYHNSPNSLLSEYDVTSGWSGISVIFGGGNADGTLGAVEKPDKMGWIKIPHDFSEFNYLSFTLKAKSAAENPKTLKIELVDNSRMRVVLIEEVTAGAWERWEEISVPLTFFSGLDKSSIKQINFVYEDWRIQNKGGSKVGALYLDELRFER